MKISEPKHPMTLKIVTSFLRLMFVFDEIEAIIGSKNANAELIPANKTAKKNKGARMRPAMPIKLNIFGNTTKINPVPSLTLMLSCEKDFSI